MPRFVRHQEDSDHDTCRMGCDISHGSGAAEVAGPGSALLILPRKSAPAVVENCVPLSTR